MVVTPEQVQGILNEIYAADDDSHERPWERLIQKWSLSSIKQSPVGYDDFLDILFIRDRLERLLSELQARFGEVPTNLQEALTEADQDFMRATLDAALPLAAREGWWWSRVPRNLTPEFSRHLSARRPNST